jgi:hypothetical protein
MSVLPTIDKNYVRTVEEFNSSKFKYHSFVSSGKYLRAIEEALKSEGTKNVRDFMVDTMRKLAFDPARVGTGHACDKAFKERFKKAIAKGSDEKPLVNLDDQRYIIGMVRYYQTTTPAKK